jgi:hypothetical protein
MNYVSDINDSTIFNVSSTLDAAQVEMHRPWSCAVCVFENPGLKETCGLCGTQKLFRLNVNSAKGINERQRAARRRREWTRKLDENGQLQWVRYNTVTKGSEVMTQTKEGIRLRQSGGEASFNSYEPSAYDAKEADDVSRGDFSFFGMNQNKSSTLATAFVSELDMNGQLHFVPTQDFASLHTDADHGKFLGETSDIPTEGGASFVSPSAEDGDGGDSAAQLNDKQPASQGVATDPNNSNPESPVANPTATTAAKTDGKYNQWYLEMISTLPFRDKWQWFMDEMAVLQQPYELGHVLVEVRRSRLLADSVPQFSLLDKCHLHKHLRVKFVGEPSVDAGGVQREWFTTCFEEIFSEEMGLFQITDKQSNSYQINPLSQKAHKQDLRFFFFVGRMIGKALMDQMLMSPHLCLPLLKHIVGAPITLSDLRFLDLELYESLKFVYETDDVESLALDFTVCHKYLDYVQNVALIEDGESVAVMESNRDEYLLLQLKYRLMTSIRDQLRYLLKGVYEVIPRELLSVFDYQELELLLCGVPEIDVQDWKRNTVYEGLFQRQGARHKVVKWFWNLVESLSHEDRAKLLQYSTGSCRVPARGFKALISNDGNLRPFCVQGIRKSDSLFPRFCFYCCTPFFHLLAPFVANSFIPSLFLFSFGGRSRSHTCFNRIDLPFYSTYSELKEALLMVVQMDATGFTLE